MDDIDGSVGPGDGEIFVDFCSTESSKKKRVRFFSLSLGGERI